MAKDSKPKFPVGSKVRFYWPQDNATYDGVVLRSFQIQKDVEEGSEVTWAYEVRTFEGFRRSPIEERLSYYTDHLDDLWKMANETRHSEAKERMARRKGGELIRVEWTYLPEER